jgi:glycosyltransferase involved in cell wall biosynthesis
MISIIYTHWAMNEMRSSMMNRSVLSLLETTDEGANAQILVADNGGNLRDSEWLLNLTDQKKIAVYLRFRENMHFAYARNQLLRMATGDYIVICDNDIIFEKGWMEECADYLSKHEGVVATPLVPDISHRKMQFWCGEKGGWQLNSLAGSSCFMMTRKCFEEVGFFEKHNMSGSKYARALTKKGYLVAVMPQCKAIDIGERQGYDWRNPSYATTL